MKRMTAIWILILLLCAAAGCGDAKQSVELPSATPQMVSVGLADGTEADLPGTVHAADAVGQLPTVVSAPARDADTLTVLFINVGKADAILLCYGASNVLIDTGTEESTPQLLGALAYMGVEKLDGLYLTHTHKDHIGGVPMLARYIPIQQAYAAYFSENKKNGKNKIDEAAADAGLPLKRLSAGDTVPFAGEVAFMVLGPIAFNEDDDNDNSLVLQLKVNGRTLLLTGDMQFAEEETLLSAGTDVSADILKVGNHGNPDATGEPFAAAVSPQIAVISTDTDVDEDSANPRVFAALANARVLVTQDTTLGVLFNVAPDAATSIYDAAPAPSAAKLAIVEVDKKTQTVTLQNNGERAELSGCMLLSQRGGELFRFPNGSVIEAGTSVTIAAEGREGDFIFNGETEPWHKKKADTAILYDRFGLELAQK